MIGSTEVSVPIHLFFEHCCKDCNHFNPCKNEMRDTTLKEKLKDVFTWNQEVRPFRVISSIENYCSEKEKQVDPEAKEPCFIWTGSHEEWLPDIEATIVDGKVKVVFG